MAGKHGIALHDNIALVGATPKTVIQVFAAANHPIDITEVSVGFDGTDSTKEAVEVTLVRETDAGIGGDVLAIVGANNSDGDTFDTSALSDINGGDPTATDILRHWRVHPQTGFTYQPSSDAPIHVGAADRVGLIITAADAVNVDAYINFTE